ncbi:antitoxin VbhA family protein [Xanthomonas euvesicatoria]|uniref:antitoxin VbhA family protein n=1 Tax=Xanthomonas euvesicatoria TaxID=456327 RepID=UPI0038929848
MREAAAREAAASLRLEGLAVSEENADLRKAWIDGTMTGEEVRQAIIARAIKAQDKAR